MVPLWGWLLEATDGRPASLLTGSISRSDLPKTYICCSRETTKIAQGSGGWPLLYTV